jgi:nucleoside-diphosphate-sugar epimerase
MTNSQTVLLAGATGVFGRHISTVLTGAGYQVLGLGRGAGNAVRADLNDRDQLLRAVDGIHADVVVHAATALAKPPMRHKDMAGTNKLRTVGMRNLVEAVGVVGARRVISESMAFGYGYGPHGAQPLAEDSGFAPRQQDPKLEEHVAAMRTKEQLTFGIPGVDGIALRFGLFYGPGGTDAILPMLRKRMLPAPSTPGRVLPWINLQDAATAVLAAIENGRPGAAYNIVDDQPISFGDHLIAAAAAFGLPKPMRVPAWLLSPMGYVRAMLATDMRLDTTRAHEDLGWHARYTTSDGKAGMAAAAA